MANMSDKERALRNGGDSNAEYVECSKCGEILHNEKGAKENHLSAHEIGSDLWNNFPWRFVFQKTIDRFLQKQGKMLVDKQQIETVCVLWKSHPPFDYEDCSYELEEWTDLMSKNLQRLLAEETEK